MKKLNNTIVLMIPNKTQKKKKKKKIYLYIYNGKNYFYNSNLIRSETLFF